MRHRKKFNHLGRTSSHRKSMLANMASSLIKHKRITTTVAKAKALRPYVEPLITKSKIDSTHSRRVVFSYLKDKEAVSELFRDVSIKVAERHGGYTRILKTGNRLGDNAEMCIIELVDYNEKLLAKKEEKVVKKTRRRGHTKKKTPVVEQTKKTEKTVAEKPEKEKSEKELKSKDEVKKMGKEIKTEIKKEESKQEPQKTKDETKEEIKKELKNKKELKDKQEKEDKTDNKDKKSEGVGKD